MIEDHELIVLGAGVTGLGAAWRAEELQRDDLLLEATEQPGGLAASCVDEAGFTWDCGVHLHFSHYDYYDHVFETLFAPDERLERTRSAAAWMHGRMVPYPVQLHLHYLPPETQWECLRGLLDARPGSDRRPATLLAWFRRTFGDGVAREFLIPYNEKIWGTPLHELNTAWIGQRVAVPDRRDVLRRLCLREDHHEWGPNARFRYPRRGGAGELWKRLAERLPPARLRCRAHVVAIDADRKLITTRDGKRFRYGSLISTLPLDRLLGALRSRSALPSAARLKATRTHLVGFGLRGELPETLRERLWVYFPGAETSFYRLSLPGNIAPANVPDSGCWSVLAEVTETEWTGPRAGVADRVERELRGLGWVTETTRIVSRWEQVLPYGYPIPTLERDTVLSQLLPALRERNIWSRGRFGAWKYEVSNQDHSFMQGVEAVEAIVHGRPELTLSHPDLVNGRKNPFPYREWGDE